MTGAPLVSVVISTFNRAGALKQTLEALAGQDLGSGRYEVIVVDDGSTDDTSSVLAAMDTPYALHSVRHERNRGVSAGRNSAIRVARGRHLVMISDDVLVDSSFLRRHVETLEQLPRSWVVGSFEQLDDLTAFPFGRYLDGLEQGFEEGRKAGEIGPGLWEMTWPTARNLSLPRSDLDRIGLFDERFHTTCEDQDLAQRAREIGIRFVYSEHIRCIHNDQASDLARYCNFQQRGARDGPLLFAKHPEVYAGSALAKENGPIARSDGALLAAKKRLKLVASSRPARSALQRTLRAAERLNAPQPVLNLGYRAAIGLAIFRGWREGLRQGEIQAPADT